MPAPQRYAAPHQQLYRLAVRARRFGLSFEEFWERAVPQPEGSGRHPYLHRVNSDDPPPGTILWPRDTQDRRLAYNAILEARDCWQRAYEGSTPSRSELALAVLAPMLDRSGNGVGARVPSLV